jgi:long-chain acyl-CoA synthetase
MLSRLTSTLASRGDATALLVDETPRSYSELAVSADALAEAMRADRMAGERVALMLPNGIDLVTSYLACFASCAVATPLNARYAPPEVEQALRRARPRWLIANADRLAALQHVDSSVLSGVRIVVAGSDTMAPGDLQAPTSDIAPEADAIIFFTSGLDGTAQGRRAQSRFRAGDPDQHVGGIGRRVRR